MHSESKTKDACGGVDPLHYVKSTPLYEIHIIHFADAYQKLRDVFEYEKVPSVAPDRIPFYEYNKVVVIGGRAINLLTLRNSRGSPDVDVVVDRFREGIKVATERAEELGFKVEKEVYNPSKHDSSIRLTYPLDSMEIKFDIYHKSMGFISAVPVQYILDTAQEVHLYIPAREMNHGPKMHVNVAAPSTIVIMKFNAWIHRGKETMNKDAFDIINIINNLYGGTDAFIKQERARLLEYIRIHNALPEVQSTLIRHEDAFQLLKIDSPEKFKIALSNMCEELEAAQKQERIHQSRRSLLRTAR